MSPSEEMQAQADLVIRATSMVVNLERFITVIVAANTVLTPATAEAFTDKLTRADNLLTEIDRHIKLLIEVFEEAATESVDRND